MTALAEAVNRQKAAQKNAPLGSGKRFSALSAAIQSRGGVKDPDAVAASIGRKKYGSTMMQQLAARGKAA